MQETLHYLEPLCLLNTAITNSKMTYSIVLLTLDISGVPVTSRYEDNLTGEDLDYHILKMEELFPQKLCRFTTLHHSTTVVKFNKPSVEDFSMHNDKMTLKHKTNVLMFSSSICSYSSVLVVLHSNVSLKDL